jgi:hypothetical protein
MFTFCCQKLGYNGAEFIKAIFETVVQVCLDVLGIFCQESLYA